MKPQLFSAIIDARPRWRMCYDCFHAVSHGKEVGNKECADEFVQNEIHTIKSVNCTGICKVR